MAEPVPFVRLKWTPHLLQRCRGARERWTQHNMVPSRTIHYADAGFGAARYIQVSVLQCAFWGE